MDPAASIFARGDFVAAGGFGVGGTVNIRSFAGTLSWQLDGVGDVRPTGTVASLLAASRGTITFDNCATGDVNYSGTDFPQNGLPATTPSTVVVGACGGSPTVDAELPPCACQLLPDYQACIEVTKVCTDPRALGEPIHFNGTVSNCGTDPLNDVTVVDDNGTSSNAGDDAKVLGPVSLAVGESRPYSGSYTPLVAGPSTDTVTAEGTGTNSGVTATNEASATCTVPVAGGQGCTPGYWKNHLGTWPPLYAPNELVSAVFNVGNCSVGSKSLLEALALGGGPLFCDKVALLIHAATASVLNAASSFGFPLTGADIVSQVNAAIASGKAATVMTLQAALDADNNLGCPLN